MKYPIGIQNFSEIVDGGYVYLDTSRSFNKFADITMESFQIIFTDFWARGFDMENQMDVNF